MGRKVSGATCERLKGRQGARGQDNILQVAVFLSQVFCGRFQGVDFCSVVGGQVTSWDVEGGGGSIRATDEGTTVSIPNSVKSLRQKGITENNNRKLIDGQSEQVLTL